MSSRSGSGKRQRKHDVRIRLRDEDEVIQFDNLVRRKGYHGRTAKDDWLRSHLPGLSIIPAPPPRPITISPWDNAIGAIDRLATEIEALHDLLDRMAKKSGLAHPIVHLILQVERDLRDEEWQVALDAALEAARLKGRPYVVFLHDHDEDAEGEHMHVALCVVDSDGCPPPRFCAQNP